MHCRNSALTFRPRSEDQTTEIVSSKTSPTENRLMAKAVGKGEDGKAVKRTLDKKRKANLI